MGKKAIRKNSFPSPFAFLGWGAGGNRSLGIKSGYPQRSVHYMTLILLHSTTAAIKTAITAQAM